MGVIGISDRNRPKRSVLECVHIFWVRLGKTNHQTLIYQQSPSKVPNLVRCYQIGTRWPILRIYPGIPPRHLPPRSQIPAPMNRQGAPRRCTADIKREDRFEPVLSFLQWNEFSDLLTIVRTLACLSVGDYNLKTSITSGPSTH